MWRLNSCKIKNRCMHKKQVTYMKILLLECCVCICTIVHLLTQTCKHFEHTEDRFDDFYSPTVYVSDFLKG